VQQSSAAASFSLRRTTTMYTGTEITLSRMTVALAAVFGPDCRPAPCNFDIRIYIHMWYIHPDIFQYYLLCQRIEILIIHYD